MESSARVHPYRRVLGAASLLIGLLAASWTPALASPPPGCPLRLDVESVHAYGDTVVLHVSGLPGVGGIDIYTSWRNRVEEEHLFLVPGLTEFDLTYRWSPPEQDPLPPLEPGHYRVHAIDATGCEAQIAFRVTS